MTKAVRLGIIGFGTQGSLYAKYITDGRVPNMVVGAISDAIPGKAELVADEHPDVPFFTDHIEMLESEAIDAVITTVPHFEHPRVAIDALVRDIHVLVEKPVGVYSKQVAELNDVAAARPHLTFGIMFNQRRNPLYVRLKEIIDAGEIGEILRTNWIITSWWRPQTYYDQSNWRGTWGGEGGGVLVNQAPHQLDLWQWMCGMPKLVYAKAAFGYRRDIAVEDEVTALVDYGNGATGVFITATHDVVGTDRLEILGSVGKIVVEQSKTATVTRLAKPEVEISASMSFIDVMKIVMGEGNPDELYTQETLAFDTPWGTQHCEVLENFAANILTGEPLFAPGADGIRAVRIANAIHLSAWTGREVPVDFDADDFLRELNMRIRHEAKFDERR